MFAKILKFLMITLGILLLLGVLLIERIDRTPFQETEHYQQWREMLANLSLEPSTGEIQVGWAKENFTPARPVPMAGYGNRWGKAFEGVDDSLFVRVIAVQGPETQDKVFLLAADMLIVPPNVTARFQRLLEQHDLKLSQVHLGATHTHHGFGGWGEKAVGRLFAGKFDPEIEEFIADKFLAAVLAAQQGMLPARAYYVESSFENGVRNRLKLPGGTTDDEMRSLVFERNDGTKAVMMTYAAHSTTLPSRRLQLSRDYPGATVDLLERKKHADFAVFFAGAMGSMSSDVPGDTPFDRVGNMADSLVSHFAKGSSGLDTMQFLPTSNTPMHFFSHGIELPIPSSSGRISRNYALRPWLFKALGGVSTAYIKITLIGNTLILGMPADFSGEIMRTLDAYAKAKGINLVITGFNGQYLGYITPDHIYDENLYETVTMSWNGYQAGGYFQKASQDIIDKIGEHLANESHGISE